MRGVPRCYRDWEGAMGLDRKLKPFGEIPESFRGLRDDGIYYVDKTGFIPYLINQNRKICVFTRPRRFGKTLMLRTLQTFFEYRLDDDGNPVDNRRYFEGLKVMDAGADVLKEMGQYPVISLSFKDVSGDNYEEIVGQLREAVCQSTKIHRSLFRHSDCLGETERAILHSYQEGCASEEHLRNYLSKYTQWLNDVTGRQCVILLDEYDVPLQKAAIYDMHHPQSELFDKTVKLIGGFISSGFKSNSNLAYGIIAGCMRVAKESIFTGMNNPGVITVIDEIPDEFWGFTQKEVENMLDYYDLSDKMDALKHWYEGYSYSGREVYNPWSLLNAIRSLVNGYGEDAIQSYWVRTSGNAIIDEMIDNNSEHRHKLAQIMNGEPLWAPVYQDLSYRDLTIRPDAIWSFLLYTGYLKTIEIRQLDTGIREALMTIPNMEIRSVMNQAMQHWWQDIKLAGYNVRPMIEALFSGDVPGIMREINILLDDSISVRDAKEDFYHGMMVGVLKTQCKVKSNREYGEGYPDILVISGGRAVLLELKCILPSELKNIKREEERIRIPTMMMKQLDVAEQQIRSRHYIEGLLFDEPTVSEIKAYALCFSKKRCMVREVK